MSSSILRPRLEFWQSPGIYPILDLEYCSKYEKDPYELVELWNQNRDWIPFYQLRAKQEGIPKIREIYKTLIRKFPDFPLILNDYWKEALDWKCFGLHIGKEDYSALEVSEKASLHSSTMYLGTSCHTPEDLSALEPGLWDYTGLGPIFRTGSKQTDDFPIGASALSQAGKIANIPLTPIGGIGPQEISSLLEYGSFLFAMIAGASEKDRFLESIRILKHWKSKRI